MIINFNKITNEEMKDYLINIQGVKEINSNMLDTFGGSIGKAIYLKDRQEDYQKIEDLINQIDKNDLIEILNKAEILYKAKDEIFEMLDYINVILLKKAKSNYKYTNCINIVENTKKHLKQNANYDMTIDNMVFSIWEEVN